MASSVPVSTGASAADVLANIFAGLKNKNPDVRLQSAIDLRRYVASSTVGMAGDGEGENISRRLFELIHSSNGIDNIGGLVAIDHLIDAEGEVAIESQHNLFRFYNYVKHLLPNPDASLILAASKTLGHILAVGGPAFGESFMEQQVQSAILLTGSTHGGSSEKHDSLGMARYAGALILKELALNMPAQFVPHLPAVLDGAVLAPLRDSRLVVREAAAELLAACLEISAQRERQSHNSTQPGGYLAKILADAQAGLKYTQPEVIHGSLFAYRELLLHAGGFMKDSFIETAEAVLSFRANRDAAVRRMVVSMIPTLASYNTPAFKDQILHKAMNHLFSQLDKKDERDYALMAIGLTATAVGAEMKPFLEAIMNHIKVRLRENATAGATSGRGRAPPPPDSLLAALGLLAGAVGPTLTILLHDHLHLLFAAGLSEALRVCLTQIAHAIPPLLGIIQERLLEVLGGMLSGTGYTRPGMPGASSAASLGHSGSGQGSTSGASSVSASTGTSATHVPMSNVPPPTKEQLTLALTTLATFDFSGHILTDFAQANALPYIEDDAPEVRRAAAAACVRLFGGGASSGYDENINHEIHVGVGSASSSTTAGAMGVGSGGSYHHAVEVVSDVLGKLLTVGIADPDPSIRHTMLSSLLASTPEAFDKHLSQAENVRSLFIALNDEVFENRVVAAGLIGRMARYNPAYVMPSLRKTLIQLLTELEYSSVTSNREESTRLLTLLVHHTQRLIAPYALPMLAVLLQKAQASASSSVSGNNVSASMLICLGTLASVGGEEARERIPQLMPLFVQALQDPSLAKREAALNALGRVCSSTGYVVDPLLDYPQLLPVLGKMLRSDSSSGGTMSVDAKLIKIGGVAKGSGGAEAVKREVVKVMGILGAVDPYRHKLAVTDRTGIETAMINRVPLVTSAEPPTTSASTSSTDDYFQTVVMSGLLRVLKDPASSPQHHTAIEAIMAIFKTQGLKCVGSLPQIMPAFAAVTRSSPPRLQEFHLQQLAILIGIIKSHVRNHATEVLGLASELWDNSTLQTPIVVLIEAVGRALTAEIKPFLPTILPLLLKVFTFEGELSEKRMNTQVKIFEAFQTFGANIEEYLHLVIPIIMRSAESPLGSTGLRKKAIVTVDRLSKVVNFSDHASRIVHPLMRILERGVSELRVAVLDTLCSLMVQLGSDFVIFVPTINKCLIRHPIQHVAYDRAVQQLLNGERLTHEPNSFSLSETKVPEFAIPEAAKLTVNQIHLKQAWDTAQINTRQDWIDWIHRVGVEFIKESPSHALRACMSLVETQGALGKELFNAAFLSCWGELYEQYQDHLVRSIEIALTSPVAPSEVIRRLLDLCEYMEHEEKPLPIDQNTLGEYSTKYLAYAKALHWKELEFFANPSPAILESLISINTRLQQHDAASGALLTAREQYDVTNKEEWYERLGQWQEALEIYDEKVENDPNSSEFQIGRMRCLHALGEWEHLASDVDERWSTSTNEERRQIAPMAAAAAWSLSEWDAMDNYISTMRSDSPDRFFYRAILSVHHNQFSKALSHISKARELLHPELTAFGGPGYARSYNVMVRAQMLSELEEVVSYKQCSDQPERQQMMRKTWMKRLQGCQPEVEVWQRILQVRTLIINPEDDPTAFIKFANLCRKSDRMALAEKTINSLLTPDRLQHLREHQPTRAPPNVVYAQLKYMWAQDTEAASKEACLAELRQFTISLSNDLAAERNTNEHAQRAGLPGQRMTELKDLLARCYFKQGEWQVALNEDWYRDGSSINDVVDSYALATHFDPGWYKAWHTWAMANFNVVSQLDSQDERNSSLTADLLPTHVVQSINGFFQSIALRNEDALQDTLRLLTLWFKYGAHEDISHAIAAGFSSVEIDTWLPVIPQAHISLFIIARIQTPHTNIHRNVSNLLAEVGKQHPQALIYPLTVGSKSPSASRKEAAQRIMDRMREHSPKIVEQASVVSRELIRVAILWHEMWHEGLEEASRMYYTLRNPNGMLAVLEPLHEMLEAGPQTVRETSFTQVFGTELRHAREACRRYRQHGETRELDNAWGIYFAVFQKIEKQLPQLTALDLQYVSPVLQNIRDLDLAVPGTYQSGREVIRIGSFVQRLAVITSKQRPRRMSLKGSDGRDYQYILKGHEDLRQDERVMQLFGLVNTLLSVDTDSFKRQLHIQRNPIIPLAPNAGLIGAIQESDTLHELIRDYRHSIKLLLNIEYRLMLQMAPDYENLPLLHKIEVFEYAMDNTSGHDLYKILWLKSTNSEHWLERRASYTRSLAVNSMVGHILGLGDRHPSNVMMSRKTGKVVHIDFGDCFEVAMHRDKFPEKVPFRLTRMLTHAMEVGGIKGSFRKTSEISMRVLRANNESLMAVLEAFVYDPLINWRLMQADVGQGEEGSSKENRPGDLAWVSARPDGIPRPLRANENDIFNEAGETGVQEVRNNQALLVYNRVQAKLTGRDFDPDVALSVEDQVEKLIIQAMSLENLCQCFAGWCAFW
ncbi:Serine/threonine-protein kinase TOR [Mycena indigotica]|uniref:Serine/threonine-protein kinase TOR n=1 Tax=Mycena indigotica TaxID=2126181 RepID=A0A8H6T3Y8_9AGAR|nr:Serine/threonine-protein kinase TOR [Mycena indigotica]KAF7309821.1 Serine/threonine-protein kinase TOR [Mycena indigotica]